MFDGNNTVSTTVRFDEDYQPRAWIGRWMHQMFVVDRDASTLASVINGVRMKRVLDISPITGDAFDSDYGIKLVTQASIHGWSMDGVVDDFRFYDYALPLPPDQDGTHLTTTTATTTGGGANTNTSGSSTEDGNSDATKSAAVPIAVSLTVAVLLLGVGIWFVCFRKQIATDVIAAAAATGAGAANAAVVLGPHGAVEEAFDATTTSTTITVNAAFDLHNQGDVQEPYGSVAAAPSAAAATGKDLEHDYAEIDEVIEVDDGHPDTTASRCLYKQSGPNGQRCNNTSVSDYCHKHECTTPGCILSKSSSVEVCDTCHNTGRGGNTTDSAAYGTSSDGDRGRGGGSGGGGGRKTSSVPVVHPVAAVGGYVPPSAEQMEVYDAGDAPGASEERQMQRVEDKKKEKKKGKQQQGSVYLGFDQDNEESML